MAYRFFSIPLAQPESAEVELNRFLASVKVSGVEKHFVNDGTNSCWAVAVQYGGAPGTNAAAGTTPGKTDNRIDYRDVLSPEQFAIYDRLRRLRKEVAETEKVKVFNVFDNEQLAAMVTEAPRTSADLSKIPGIGEKRLKQYGELFLKERWRDEEAKAGEGDAAGAIPF